MLVLTKEKKNCGIIFTKNTTDSLSFNVCPLFSVLFASWWKPIINLEATQSDKQTEASLDDPTSYWSRTINCVKTPLCLFIPVIRHRFFYNFLNATDLSEKERNLSSRGSEKRQEEKPEKDEEEGKGKRLFFKIQTFLVTLVTLLTNAPHRVKRDRARSLHGNASDLASVLPSPKLLLAVPKFQKRLKLHWGNSLDLLPNRSRPPNS